MMSIERPLVMLALLAVAFIASSLSAQPEPQDKKRTAAQGQEDRPRPDLGPLIEDIENSLLPGSISRSPLAITEVSGDEVRRSGARFLTDVLRLVPGMEVVRTSSTESNVSLRGYNDASSAAQGILVLIDGRQAYNEFYGNAFWDTLPVSLDQIEQIEVIRGPSSFLYGPNAMHGLVNIITKSPLQYEDDHVSFSTSVGTDRSIISRLTYVTRDSERNAALKTTLLWDDIDQFSGDHNVRDKRVLEIRYGKRLDELGEHWFEVTGSLSDQKVDLLIPDVLGIPATGFDTRFQDTALKVDYRLQALRTKVSWTGFDATSRPDRFYTKFDVTVGTLDVDLQYAFELVRGHSMTAGSGYRHSMFKTERQDIANGRHNVDLGWVFLQDEVTLTDDLFLTAGLRLDRHSTAGDHVSPRIALVWEVDEDDVHSLRASWGKGFRNPSLREIWFGMPVNIPGLPGPVIVEGNKDLVAESIRSFEIGYTGWLLRESSKAVQEGEEDTSTRPGQMRVGVSAYYNEIDDLATFQPLGTFPGTMLTSRAAPTNTNNEEAYGFEVEAEYFFGETAPAIERMSVFGNYSYGVRKDRYTDVHSPFAPKHKANAGLRWSNVQGSAGWNTMIWGHFFDETELFGQAVDDYVLINGSLSYQAVLGESESGGKTKLGRFFLQAFNLFDNDHQEHPQGNNIGLTLTGGFEFTW